MLDCNQSQGILLINNEGKAYVHGHPEPDKGLPRYTLYLTP